MNKQQGSIHIILICALVVLLVGALVYVFINRSFINKADTAVTDVTSKTEVKTHKVTIPAGWGGGEALAVKPGSVVSDDVYTVKYIGANTDFKDTSLLPEPGMKFVKADFSIKRLQGSKTLTIRYNPDVLPVEFKLFGTLLLGSLDYGTYTYVNPDETSFVDPYSGKTVKHKRITIGQEESFEQIFHAKGLPEYDKFYDVYVLFEVPKEDNGKITIMFSGKSYYI